MAWSADGQTLFAGYSDNKIRVWVSPRPAKNNPNVFSNSPAFFCVYHTGILRSRLP